MHDWDVEGVEILGSPFRNDDVLFWVVVDNGK